ncbi:ATP-binding protein [Massilia putida]|uniref:ATP-binding protein n=1 Tax=Massilia putida TaxID=1141883 RepID=UPI000951DA11|nr:ATP-binding protein [Massilia putida]
MTTAHLQSAAWTEAARLAALDRYGILDTPTEAAFDAIVRLVADLLDAPIAAVNLIAGGRQWFKSEIGLGVRQMPLDDSICKHALLEESLMVVPDTASDVRFACNPLVTGAPGLRFYAGALLRTPEGIALGTLCVLDLRARPQGISVQQRLALRTLGDQVMTLLELRRAERERHAAEQALRRTRAELDEARELARGLRSRLDALLAAAPVGISYADRTGKLVMCNDELERLWGEYPRTSSVADYAEWKGWWADHSERHGRPVAPDEWAQARALRGEHADGDVIDIEPFHTPGRRRTVIIRAAPVLDAGGAVAGSVTAIIDVTRQLHTENAARASRARLETILEAGEIGTWTWDIAAGRVHADANVAAMFGVAAGGDGGIALDDYVRAIHPDDTAAVRASLDRALANGEPHQLAYRVRDRAGVERTVHTRGRVELDAAGTPVRMSGVVFDISRQAAAEARLRSSESARRAGEQRYHTVLKSIDVGFCIIEMIFDAAGEPYDYRIVETNPAFVRHTGLADAAGKRIRELVPEHDVRWSRIYGRVAKTGLPVRIEQHAANLGRWLDVYAARLGDDDSHHVAVFLRDITEERARRETLRELADTLGEANRRQSEFLATLAHELRNPLAPVRTGLDLLRIGADKPDVLARVRPMMERQVNHLVHLVDDLLDVARISSGKVELKMTVVPLKDIVLRAIEMTLPVIEAKRHDFHVDVGDDPLHVLADATRLAQVVGNLLTNAAKYTPEGGSIGLGVRRNGDRVRVEVADSGIGIPRESLARIFDMFAQVGRHREQESGGLGIGLHLVRQMTALHGGTVAADSPGPGRGSTFVVDLPLASAAAPQAPDAPDAPRRALGLGPGR